jgi:phage baseplate assembly protein W
MSFDLKIRQGDIAIGSDGDLEKVENTAKLIQDVLKILMTPLGSNPFHSWYGSLISSSIVGNPFEDEFLVKIADSQIRSALETIQNLQRAQMASSQKVTANELLAAVKDVKVVRNPVDPRFFSIFITILSKGLNSANVSFNISNYL